MLQNVRVRKLGRPKADLWLSAAEKSTLEEWARRGKTAQRLAMRARIVLACAEGLDSKVVAEHLRVTQQTVGKWRGRFVRHRLEGCTTSTDLGRREPSRTRSSKPW